MGSDDIIKDLYYANNGTQEDLGTWEQTDAIPSDYTSTNTLLYQSVSGGYYQTLLKNRPTEEWEMTVVLRHLDSENSYSTQSRYWVKLNDGYYYSIGIVGRFDVGNNLDDVVFSKTLTRPTDTYENMTFAHEQNQDNFTAITLRFKTNGFVDVVVKSNSYPSISTMRGVYPTLTNVHALEGVVVLSDAMQWDGAKITEIGFSNAYRPGENSVTISFAGMYVGADTATPAGGSADLGDIKNLSATKMFSGGGGANIFSTYDANVVDEADIRANYRKSIIIQDTVHGVMRFKGEIDYIDIIRDADMYHVNYRASEDIRKLTKQFCRTTPVKLRSKIKSVKDNIVYDYLASWDDTDNGEFENKILTTTDDDLYKSYVFPTSVSLFKREDDWSYDPADWTVSVPVEEAGSIDNLYFDDQSKTDDNAYGIVGTIGGITSPYHHIMVFEFKVYEHEDTNEWDQTFLEIIGRWNSFDRARVWGSSDDWYPKLTRFNYTTGLYELVYQYTPDDHATSDVGDTENWLLDELNTPLYNASTTGAGKSPVFTDKIGVVFGPDDKTDVSEVNDAGFVSYTVKIAVNTTTPDLNSSSGLFQRYPILELYQMELLFDQEFTKGDPQGQNFSVGKIASNTTNTITLDTTANAGISVDTFPQGDGVTKNDDYYISDNLEEIITDIFETADTDFIRLVDFDEDYTLFGEIDDIYDTPIYDYIQKQSSNHNWAFWSASTTEIEVIKIADNFDSSGVTLTSSDILNYSEGGLDLQENAKSMYDKVTVVGADGLRASKVNGTDYNTEYNNTLGNEEIIYRDSELYTKRNVTAYARTKSLLHSAVLYDVVLTLDLTADTGINAYAAIDIGKTVAIETDELSTSAIGDGHELVVESMVYTSMEEQGGREFLTLHLQRRMI